MLPSEAQASPWLLHVGMSGTRSAAMLPVRAIGAVLGAHGLLSSELLHRAERKMQAHRVVSRTFEGLAWEKLRGMATCLAIHLGVHASMAWVDSAIELICLLAARGQELRDGRVA